MSSFKVYVYLFLFEKGKENKSVLHNFLCCATVRHFLLYEVPYLYHNVIPDPCMALWQQNLISVVVILCV